MNHHHAAPARGLEHALAGCDDRLQRCNVVAERLAEATRLDEIPLHVYDDERGRRRIELEFIRLGAHFLYVHGNLKNYVALAAGETLARAKHVTPNNA